MSWDVALVDGPGGWAKGKNLPGRVGSLKAAKEMVKQGGTIFVHDCNRLLEDQVSKHLLGDDYEEIKSESRGHLRRFDVRRPK